MTDYEPDVAAQITAVERSVAVTDDGGPAVHTVQTLRQEYPTDAADLWDAVTTSERLARWFAPVSGDLTLGGKYQVEGNASGTIESCEAPSSFTATWEFGGAVTRIEVRIEPVGDRRAALVLQHVGDTPREFWDQFGPGATGVGWDLGMLGLHTYLATGTDRPAEADTWGQTESARAFMSESSKLWAEATIAAGIDPATARAAADRTTAFYTGTPG